MNSSKRTINRIAKSTKQPVARLAEAICAIVGFKGLWMHKTKVRLEGMFT